ILASHVDRSRGRLPDLLSQFFIAPLSRSPNREVAKQELANIGEISLALPISVQVGRIRRLQYRLLKWHAIFRDDGERRPTQPTQTSDKVGDHSSRFQRTCDLRRRGFGCA